MIMMEYFQITSKVQKSSWEALYIFAIISTVDWCLRMIVVTKLLTYFHFLPVRKTINLLFICCMLGRVSISLEFYSFSSHSANPETYCED